VSRPHTREVKFRGQPMTRVVQSDLRIRRHRDEERSVYDVARQDYRFADFVGYDIVEVKLAFRLARQAQRRARTVTVEVRAPNGLSDRCKTDADRELIFAQLVNLGCAWQY
jgi:23S rRNA pseudoU1915 N3-methylase RlmH